MRIWRWMGLMLCGGCLALVPLARAQQDASAVDALVKRMMEFDRDGDGAITRAEVSDERLTRLLDRADADKDGMVTKADLTELATKEAKRIQVSPDFGPPPGGPGGFGPGGSGGPGMGPGGPMMGPPRPGDVLPAFLRRGLNLSDEQKTQLDELQKDVDARLAKILTSEQKKTLEQAARRGFGPPGGPGGPGGPGPRRGPGSGGPPGGRGGPPPDEPE